MVMKSFKTYHIKEAANSSDFLEKFIKGFEVEKEHSETVNNDFIVVARIALDHLEEDINYYSKLEKVEK